MHCPDCGGKRIWKDGIRYVREGQVQRYLCRSCGHRFSDCKVEVDVFEEGVVFSDSVHDFGDLDLVDVAVGDVGFHDSAFTVGKDVRSHSFPIVGKTINDFLPNNKERRVCASEREAKNLVKVESQIEKRDAGTNQTDLKGQLVDYSWWLKKNGYAESTVITNTKTLKTLLKRGANLLDPESVKEGIARQKWDPGTKAIAVWAYDSFAKMMSIRWERPIYKQIQKMPFVPMETEIDQLIAGLGKKTAVFTQIVKETGARPGEIWRLKWVDIDTINNVFRINEPEKNSNPRIVRVSNKLMAMLNVLPRNSEKVFKRGPLRYLRRTFSKQRESIAKKLQNPRIQKVTWCSIRHWKGTMEYHKTKDILYVMKVLGHKNIRNTLVYINLENAIFQTQNDQFTVRVAKTSEEIQQLLEVGFEYVCEKDSLLYFRKRK